MQIVEKMVKIEKSVFYPEISLLGQYERNVNNPGVTENNFSNESNAIVSLQAHLRLFEWGKRKTNVEKIKYRKQAIEERLRGLKEMVKLEIKEALLQARLTHQNIETASTALGQARENFRITSLQYDQYIATSTDVLDARTFLSVADMNYYRAIYGYLISLSALHRATWFDNL